MNAREPGGPRFPRGVALVVQDLGRGVPYAAALARQEEAQSAAQRGADDAPDTLLLMEHAPVFTLGRTADEAHLLWPEEERRRRGIALARTDRGGDVTYHGPGQLVGWPILRIGRDPRAIRPYLTALEEALLRSVARFGVAGRRDRRNRGVWVANDKLAAIGVRCAGGVTTHGFALNVDPDLNMYAGIVACGLADAGVTSLARLLGGAPAMAEVRQAVVAAFIDVFGFADVRCCYAVAASETRTSAAAATGAAT